MLLPPAESGQPAPRISFIQAAYAAKVLVQDMSGMCERNPAACATSRETLSLLTRKIQTGAGIVSAGLAAGQSAPDADSLNHGTLRAADLQPDWSLANSGL